MKLNRFWGLLPALLLWATLTLGAEPRRTATNLPYRFPQGDVTGNSWMLFNGGRLMHQGGNMPFCSEAATLLVSGQGVQGPAQTATLEGNEIILENMRAGVFTVTRRILQLDDGTLRITDIVRNPRNEEAAANLMVNFNVNFGVQATRMVADLKKADRSIGVITTDSQNRTLLSMYAGRGAKLTPTLNAQNGTNQVQAIFELKIPAGKEKAIVHFHQFASSNEQADKFAAQLRESRAITSLPTDVRKIIANYPVATSQLDELDQLRSSTTDVVELNSSDQLRGDLLVTQWEMETTFGRIQVPGEQVAGMIVTPGPQPRQLLVTTDGEMIGGKLTITAIDLQTSSGQRLSLPMAQVSRVGRRATAAGDVEARKMLPMVHLRSGDRLAVKLPQQPIRFATSFGMLEIAPSTIATLDLQPEQSPVHILTLTDGSRFSGVLLSEKLETNLTRGPAFVFPANALRRLAFAAETDSDADTPSATLRLTGDDVLTVTLAPTVVVATTYGNVTINGPEVKRIARVKETAEDLQFALWDDSVITGQLAEPFLQCTLAGAVAARIAAGTIELYECSAPQPSAAAVEQVKRLVANLNADDWKQREQAESQLTGMGEAIAPILKQMRNDQPPEAQERIDSILKQFARPGNKPANRPAIAPRAMNGMLLR